MGLGAYLAAVTERDHYICEENREREEVATKPNDEREEIYEIMEGYGVGREATTPLVEQLTSNVDQWIRVRSAYTDFLHGRTDQMSIVYDGFRTQARET